jgi:hypothetical protein
MNLDDTRIAPLSDDALDTVVGGDPITDTLALILSFT